MEFIGSAIDFVLHIDRHLVEMVAAYGTWIYAILFVIVFLETGVVVAPFLPGDSLLFAAGALAATGALDIFVLIGSLAVAAIVGDSVNYSIGRMVGPRVFTQQSRWLKQEHLVRTQEFYERHGGKTIVLARFLPFLRTFAPFVAGVGEMNYLRFWIYNASGGVLWVAGFGLLGFYFGSHPFVQRHFGLVIVGIIVISAVPAAVEVWKAWRRRRARQRGA
jgi:membrane-associated protein